MDQTRRDFLKLTGVGAAATMLPLDAAARSTEKLDLPAHKAVGRTTTICPYCAVGCGMLVGVEDGRVVNIEGDPEHPINQGALCSKGSTLSQLVNSPRRITKPAYRAPGADSWQEVEWDWALDQIAQRIKRDRDAGWIERDEQGRVVRRTERLASVGSAALDNEECSLLIKALRSMGLVYVEHQARI
jgi:formate dehydrogenase major subunit